MKLEEERRRRRRQSRQNITPETSIDELLDLDLDLVDDNDNGKFEENRNVYHTPPYELNEKSSHGVANVNVDQKKFLIQLSTLLSRYSSGVIKNGGTIAVDSSVSHFFTEVIGRSKCNKQTILLAALYFKQIYSVSVSQSSEKKLPEFILCIKRTFLASLIIAHKFLNDNTYSLKSWQMISGLSAKNLAMMEKYCLLVLNFNLHIGNPEIVNLENEIVLMVTEQDLMDSINALPIENHIITNKNKRSHDEIEDLLVDEMFGAYLRPQQSFSNKKICKISIK